MKSELFISEEVKEWQRQLEDAKNYLIDVTATEPYEFGSRGIVHLSELSNIQRWMPSSLDILQELKEWQRQIEEAQNYLIDVTATVPDEFGSRGIIHLGNLNQIKRELKELEINLSEKKCGNIETQKDCEIRLQ